MKTKRLTSLPTQPNLEELTLGDLIRSHSPEFNVTLLASKPLTPDPEHPYESFMVMPVQYFMKKYTPDHFRIHEGGWKMVTALKNIFSRELGKVW
jgi:hypothetical protein